MLGRSRHMQPMATPLIHRTSSLISSMCIHHKISHTAETPVIGPPILLGPCSRRSPRNNRAVPPSSVNFSEIIHLRTICFFNPSYELLQFPLVSPEFPVTSEGLHCTMLISISCRGGSILRHPAGTTSCHTCSEGTPEGRDPELILRTNQGFISTHSSLIACYQPVKVSSILLVAASRENQAKKAPC